MLSKLFGRQPKSFSDRIRESKQMMKSGQGSIENALCASVYASALTLVDSLEDSGDSCSDPAVYESKLFEVSCLCYTWADFFSFLKPQSVRDRISQVLLLVFRDSSIGSLGISKEDFARLTGNRIGFYGAEMKQIFDVGEETATATIHDALCAALFEADMNSGALGEKVEAFTPDFAMKLPMTMKLGIWSKNFVPAIKNAVDAYEQLAAKNN